jgi:hypothetical protein
LDVAGRKANRREPSSRARGEGWVDQTVQALLEHGYVEVDEQPGPKSYSLAIGNDLGLVVPDGWQFKLVTKTKFIGGLKQTRTKAAKYLDARPDYLACKSVRSLLLGFLLLHPPSLRPL